MLFRELNRTTCKSYLLACEQTRKAILIDPLKDRVDRYLAVLAYYQLSLEYAIDTHTHADHRTGTRFGRRQSRDAHACARSAYRCPRG